jgi:UDP-glucose 4-epimerase
MARSMRTLVTGGAGFIGSNVVDALLERGDEVTVVDNLTTGKRENLEKALAAGGKLVEADMRDGQAMKDVAAQAQPEVVFHLGAQIDVRRSVADPAFDATVNVIGTINMLAAAHEAGARRFVNSSTGGAIYGEGRQIPAPETHPQEPEAGYGQSKLSAEGYCELFRRLHGFSTVSLRYGNVYGPRQDPHGEAGVVAIFLGALARGERARIFGDGLQTRDYVYVGDVARATTSTVGQDQGVYNVGTGRETSVVELYELCARVAGSDAEPEHAPARLGELRRSFLDPTRAARELGFTAMVDLEDGLRATWDWVLKE